MNEFSTPVVYKLVDTCAFCFEFKSSQSTISFIHWNRYLIACKGVKHTPPSEHKNPVMYVHSVNNAYT